MFKQLPYISVKVSQEAYEAEQQGPDRPPSPSPRSGSVSEATTIRNHSNTVLQRIQAAFCFR
eukprot:2750467-Amphidinium_carterae.2